MSGTLRHAWHAGGRLPGWEKSSRTREPLAQPPYDVLTNFSRCRRERRPL